MVRLYASICSDEYKIPLARITMINTRQMQGVWLENRSLTIRNDLTIPTPNPDEALIRVLLAGICGTDVQLRKGYYPFNGIPGQPPGPLSLPVRE